MPGLGFADSSITSCMFTVLNPISRTPLLVVGSFRIHWNTAWCSVSTYLLFPVATQLACCRDEGDSLLGYLSLPTTDIEKQGRCISERIKSIFCDLVTPKRSITRRYLLRARFKINVAR